MRLIQFLLNQNSPTKQEVAGHSCSYFSDLETFLQSREAAEGIVVDGDDAGMVERLVRELRSNVPTSCTPVFLLKDLGPGLGSLVDGMVGLDEAVGRITAISERLAELPADILTHGRDFRLLAYLYGRPDTLLTTIRSWQHPRVYYYPVAELLADATTDVDRWLGNMLERGLLERVELLDRLRACPKCGGCHHNFIDICPESRSIDIVQKPFLHCFTCGHVAPQETFLTAGVLVCPRCHTRLRHIGTDYDRPLENYLCNDCGRSFIEPLVIARCMTCGAENSTEMLVPKPIYSLGLAEHGRIAVKTGSIGDIFALFDNLNYIRPQFFESLLDWLLAVCQRHPEERFSLIGLQLKNVLQLTDRIGRHRTTELMDEFAVRLRDAIRKTDPTTRTSERTLWILLPKTDRPGCQKLVDRIESIRRNTQQPEGIALEYDAVRFSAPVDVVAGEPAGLLLARLLGDLE